MGNPESFRGCVPAFLRNLWSANMSRWSAYGRLDSRLLEDGDNAFTGVDMTRDRALLHPGTLARSENKRLRIGAVATCLGNVQVPDFQAPFINKFIGSG